MAKFEPRSRARRVRGAAIGLLCLLAVSVGAAQARTPPQDGRQVLTLEEAAALLRIEAQELERLSEQKQVPARRVGSVWRFNRETLLAWLNGDWEPGARTAQPRATSSSLALLDDPPRDAWPALTGSEMSAATATGTTVQQTGATADTAPLGDRQDAPIGDAPEGRTAEDVFLRGRRVLLRRGEVVLDLGQFYSRSDTLQLAAVEDRLGLATLEQATHTSLVLGRVGIFDETEVFASTAFRRQDRQMFVGNTALASTGRTDFGSVAVGFRRTLLHERVGRPDLIANLAVRFPAGAASYGIGGGLVLVKSVDPVVLFASTNYVHSFGRSTSNVVRWEPEATIDASIGYGLALNDTLAISTSFSGLFTRASAFDAGAPRQTDVFIGRFALTSRLAEKLYVEPSVSFGLSGPSDSFALGVTIPYSF